MGKVKQIKNWRIKEDFLKAQGGVPGLMLGVCNGDLEVFGNVNQAVGAIMQAGLSNQLQTIFEMYSSYGIWLSKNDAVEINFKPKKGEPEKKTPTYC